MSYTGLEIFNLSMAVMDELSDAGTVIESQVKDYKSRAPYLLDLWQKERPGLLKTVTIARHPVRNLLGEKFDTLEHIREDRIYEASAGARSAVFYVTDQASVYIEELLGGSWVGASGYYSKDNGDETAFNGLIAVSELSSPAGYKCRFSSSGNVRLRFSGDYYYLYYNFALFEAAFSSCAKVPEYGEYVKYSMPADFDDMAELVEETPGRGFSHRWEGIKDLYIRYDFDGILKLTYNAAPVKITSLNQTLEVDEKTATSGAYYLAEQFALTDGNEEMAAICGRKYDELRAMYAARRPLSASVIEDVYGVGGIR